MMTKPDWFTRVGDKTDLDVTLCDDTGAPADLDGYDVSLILWGPRTVSADCRVVDAPAGAVEATPVFVTPGQYRGRFLITSTAGAVISYPTNRDFLITVRGNP